MPDHPESSPFHAFDRDDAIRQSFAYQLRHDEVDIARDMCARLVELSREAGGRFVYPERSEPLTQQELRAAAVDLRHVEGFLTEIGADEERTASRQEARAAEFAGRVATEVRALAASLEAVVENWQV